MYNDMKKFLEGKDPKFEEELQLINSSQTYGDKESNNEADKFKILKKYKSTDAYKRLLKR